MIFRFVGGLTFVIFALTVSTALRAADIVGTITLARHAAGGNSDTRRS